MFHIAEVLLALLFVAGGLSTLRDPKPRVAEISRLHFPFPELAVRANAALMIAAGVALALDVYSAVASAVLAVLLAFTTVFGHAFWIEQGDRRQLQAVHFLKNLSVLGGLLLIALPR